MSFILRTSIKRSVVIAVALLMFFSVIPTASSVHAAGMDTKLKSVTLTHKVSYKGTIKDTITVTPAYGRTIHLSVYNPYQKKWYPMGKYKTADKKTANVTITYPSSWKARDYATWLISAPKTKVRVKGKMKTLNARSVKVMTYNQVVKAKAAVVMDAKTGQCVYAKNATEKRKIASMTKMMTMIIVSERKALNQTVKINDEAIKARRMSGGMGLKKGDIVTVKDLMYCSLLPSANDAAAAAAVSVSGSQAKFKKLMRQKAVSIGAVDSTYEYAFGDWYGNAKSTAFDQALIGREFMTSSKCGYVRKVSKTKNYRFTTKRYKKTYNVTYSYAGNLLLDKFGSIGIKTGYNPPAGRCFTNAWYHRGKLYISVVMGEPSANQMWADVKTLTSMTNYLVDHNSNKMLVKSVPGK